MRLTVPTPSIRAAAEPPVGPPHQGSAAMIAYQSQPSPARLTVVRARTTQARVDAPCIQSATKRSRSSQRSTLSLCNQRSCCSGHDGNGGGRRLVRIDGVLEAGFEALDHFVQ